MTNATTTPTNNECIENLARASITSIDGSISVEIVRERYRTVAYIYAPVARLGAAKKRMLVALRQTRVQLSHVSVGGSRTFLRNGVPVVAVSWCPLMNASTPVWRAEAA